jgi:coenzyme F420 biosynthesis associated uncharacterized protein
MVDWNLAQRVALGIAAAQATPDPAPFKRLAGPAAESERVVRAYTGFEPLHALPAAEPVARSAWVEANLASLRTVIDPATQRVGEGLGSLRGPVSAAAGAVLAVEIGVISGFLATRVLGQYEFPVLEPGGPARLLFVAPNLANAAKTFDAEPEELLRWVAFHETTHALQFGAVPWLREHLAGMVRELMAGLDVDPRQILRMPPTRDLGALIEAVREGNLATLVIGEERRAVMDRVQAFMAVLEGYAEHVMDAAGPELLPSLPELRAALTKRRKDSSGLLRLLERLLGFDLKLRQYEQGKAFCDAVVAREGIGALNRVWEAPALMPTLRELDDAEGWLARTTPAGAGQIAGV